VNKKIAILEGDGIGPEIVKESLKVLSVIEKKYNHSFEKEYAPFGAEAYFALGDPFPQRTQDICDNADAIIKGPVGLAVEEMNNIPIEKRPEKGAILPLRKRYNTYMNLRPVTLPKSLAHFSPLKSEIIGDGIDIIMVRELVGGIYFGKKTEGASTCNKYATDNCEYTYEQVESIARDAFRMAKESGKKLTNIHKCNVLATSRFWNMVVDEVRKEFPDVSYHSVLVDNAAFQLCKNPRQFNGIMLLENMQGDILTDQAGGILGSLGLMPSACIGPIKGYVEAAHGSAPDIAGQNIANPYSMIGSIALMLEALFDLKLEASMIWKALRELFERGYSTYDLAGNETPRDRVLSTSDFGDLICSIIEE